MTNGEKIGEIFPNLEISPDPYSPSVDICVGGIMMMWVDRNWWDAEYKEPTTKNDLGVDCISRADVERIIEDGLQSGRLDYDAREIFADIEDLPSVTPQEPQTFKWCETCKEYDQEKHCCHRWSKVIRDTVEEIKQEPFINKPCVSSEVCEHDKQNVLDKIRAEIAEYGSIWVQYQITGRRDKDIEQLVIDVLKQAKEQVLEVIDKYRGEQER